MRLANYTVRALRRRSGRTLMTIGGVAIGVAAVVSIMIAVHTANDSSWKIRIPVRSTGTPGKF